VKLGLSHYGKNTSCKSEKRVLRIFGPKRGGAKGDWRKLHDEELHNLYASQNIISLKALTVLR
jgi:hypothetical protein